MFPLQGASIPVLGTSILHATQGAFHVVLVVKNLLPMQETQETQVPSLNQENPLEEEMATHSSTPAWRIP